MENGCKVGGQVWRAGGWQQKVVRQDGAGGAWCERKGALASSREG